MDVGAEPYTCVVSPDGKTVYVSVWGGAKVLAFDAATLEKRGEMPVGEHPNAMVFSKDGARLFVACANTNTVWVVDLASKTAKEQISIALFPNAPPGSDAQRPRPLARTATRLLVANADNNTVAVVNVGRSGAQRRSTASSRPAGIPTAAQFSKDGTRIFILSGKGLTSQANPRGSHPGIPGMGEQYSGAMLQGSLSIVAAPRQGDARRR